MRLQEFINAIASVLKDKELTPNEVAEVLYITKDELRRLTNAAQGTVSELFQPELREIWEKFWWYNVATGEELLKLSYPTEEKAELEKDLKNIKQIMYTDNDLSEHQKECVTVAESDFNKVKGKIKAINKLIHHILLKEAPFKQGESGKLVAGLDTEATEVMSLLFQYIDLSKELNKRLDK